MAVLDGLSRHVTFEKDSCTGYDIKAILEVLWELVNASAHPDLIDFFVCACCKYVCNEPRRGVAANQRLEAVLSD